MAAAAAAMHLGANHAVAAVFRGLDRARDRIIEARPAGAALEFPLRLEQPLAAARTRERAVPLLVVQGTAAGRLGGMTAQHFVLFGREQLAPLRVRMGDRTWLAFHRVTPHAAHAGVRSSSTLDTPSGVRMKQRRTPGRTVVGSLVNSTPLALRSAAMASMPLTVSPK